MQIVWSPLAIDDRSRILDYIAADAPRAAIAVDTRLGEAIGSLAHFPESGRPGRIAGTRELVITGLPYVVPYRVTGQQVLILRILHAAQLWP
jgi:toxin ParE1/3/4